MSKNEYLLESFKNIQELIRFSDAKVGAILVVFGIEFGCFLSLVEKYQFVPGPYSWKDIVIFIFGAIFTLCSLLGIFIALLAVLRPREAKHYAANQRSLLYYGHIVAMDKTELGSKAQELDSEGITREILGQLFEVSKILVKKNKYCRILIWLIAFSVISIAGMFVLTKI
jgi:hypothetical protein